MARDVKAVGNASPVLDGHGMRIGIAASRFNDVVTIRLLEGVYRGLESTGVPADGIVEVWVPGAFELPMAAQALIRTSRVDAVVCIGCVIRGETAHFEHVSSQVCIRNSDASRSAPACPFCSASSPPIPSNKRSPGPSPLAVTTAARTRHAAPSRWPR